MMVSVLLRLKSSGILDEYPNLATYVARGEARPAYKRAFAAQFHFLPLLRPLPDRVFRQKNNREGPLVPATGHNGPLVMGSRASSVRLNCFARRIGGLVLRLVGGLMSQRLGAPEAVETQSARLSGAGAWSSGISGTCSYRKS
jgi:hypothetical protein